MHIKCILLSKNDLKIYISYLQSIQKEEEERKKSISKIINIFIKCSNDIQFQGKLYLQNKLIQQNLINIETLIEKFDLCNLIDNLYSKYFAHYKNVKENSDYLYAENPYAPDFIKNFDELSKNDWELHKKLIEEGHNPNEIAKVIRNDEIEKLQEISSQPKFDFNQIIEPSLYERCDFINKKNVTLIDYAAFFGSVKCFKYLLMNNANVYNTGKYAIAGGNEEIIHLCEQNNSSFKNAYSAAIEFHQNDIFRYLYENNLEKLDKTNPKNINKLGIACITHDNFTILSFLEDEGNMNINDSFINASIETGNLYLLLYYLPEVQNFKNIFVCSWNIELVKYILEQKGIDVNAKNIFMLYLKFILII